MACTFDPLWRKAPLRLLRFRGLLIALWLGSALLTAALSAYPLLMAATANDLVNESIARPTVTRFGAGMAYRTASTSLGGNLERMKEIFAAAAAHAPDLGPVVSTLIGPQMTVSLPGRRVSTEGNLLASTDALNHVHVVSGAPGEGVWLPTVIAQHLGARAGEPLDLSLGGIRARVVIDGVYRDLNSGPLPPYWLLWSSEVVAPPDVTPPTTPIIVDPGRFRSLARKFQIGSVSFGLQAPLRAGHPLTLEEARAQAESTLAFKREITWNPNRPPTELTDLFYPVTEQVPEAIPPGFGSTEFRSSLPDVVRDVDRRIAATQSPGRLVQTAAIALALIVIASAGGAVLQARPTEASLLAAQGVAPRAVATRTGLECLLPCIVGGGVGFGLTNLLIRVLRPAAPISGAVVWSAGLWTIGAVVTSVLVLSIVAGLRYASESHRPGTRLRSLAALPIGIGVLLLAWLAWRAIQRHGALSIDATLKVERPSLALLFFPLLLLGGAGLVGAAAFKLVARGLRRRRALPSPTYLAVHRVAAGTPLAEALIAAFALALGIFVQSQATVRSLQATVDAKAGIYVGSDVDARITYTDAVPRRFAFPTTRIVRFPAAGTLPSGQSFDLLAVDPSTFADAAYWNGMFSDLSLDELMTRLAGPSGGPLPVVIAGGAPADFGSIETDQHAMPVHVVGTASAFPGLTSLRPLLVVDERSFVDAFPGSFNPLDVVQASTELWIRGEEDQIVQALPLLGFKPSLVVTFSEVRDIPYISAVIETFVVLKLLGVVAALLVIAGILTYLHARERSQVVSYGLSLRMGMSHREHRRALVSELGGMLGSSCLVGSAAATGAALLLVPKLDPLSAIPPGPLFLAPSGSVALAALGIAATAWAGGWFTNRRARRIDLGEVMRLAE
jgi:hypothetical protein